MTSKRRIFWAALRGEDCDHTSLPLNRSVLILAIPMVLEMAMEALFALTDVFWVSRLGSDAVAVVGLTESVMSLVYAVAIGTSIAATAIVARRIGEKDTLNAGKAAGQVILIGVALATAIGIAFAFTTEDVLRWMGASDQVIAQGANYARLMLGGNITVFMIFLINAVFRGAGDAAIAMRTLWLANGLNIILDPCFIFGWGPFPELGVTGAAVATNIGRGVGVVYQLWHLTARSGRVRVHLADLKPDFPLINSVLKTAGPGVAQFAIATTSWLGMYKILASFGSPPLAGYTIAVRIMMFWWMPAWGLSNASATLVGQNLGAKQPDRAVEAVGIAGKYNVIFLGTVGALMVIFHAPIARIFTEDTETLGHASQALWIVSLSFPLVAAGMCLESAFNGAGDTRTPTWVNFFCLWLGQVPLAWFLAHSLGMGPLGVYIAVPVSFAVWTLVCWILFRRGKWKSVAI